MAISEKSIKQIEQAVRGYKASFITVFLVCTSNGDNKAAADVAHQYEKIFEENFPLPLPLDKKPRVKTH